TRPTIHRPFLRFIPQSLHIPLLIAVAIILVVSGVGIIRSLTNSHTSVSVVPSPPPPRPPIPKPIGTATTRSTVSLLKDAAESSPLVATLNAGVSLEILEPTPSSFSRNEWVLVRTQGETANQGHLHLRELDQVRTGNHQFNLGHALALIKDSSDPQDLKSRLENLTLDVREADEIYVQLGEEYARLAELSITDKTT